MPGNLDAAAPTGVLPQNIFSSFVESRSYPVLSANYHDGTYERSIVEDGINAPASLRTWKAEARNTPAALATLRAFWDAHGGGLIPFYFYNPFEPVPGHEIGSNYDATGISTQGRHTGV